MKYLIHVPTESFGFVSAEVEGTPEDASLEYKSLSEAFRAGIGLPDREFNDWSERYLSREDMTSKDLESYQQMSTEQQSHIQWAKRAFKRIKK